MAMWVSTIYIQGFAVANFTNTTFFNETSQFDSICFFSIYSYVSIVNATFTVKIIISGSDSHFIKNCTAKKGALIITSKTEGQIINATTLNFNASIGPLISFSEILTFFHLISVKILYSSLEFIPYINIFDISNSIMNISDIFVPFFKGKTIISVELSSMVSLKYLRISNVSSQTSNRGCLFEFYSNSQITLSDSYFVNFRSNTSLVFSLLATCMFSGIHFKDIYKINTGKIKYDTSGLNIQSAKFTMEDSSVIEYNFEFFFAQNSDAAVVNCEIANIRQLSGQYSWATALEFAVALKVNVTNCRFINLTRSDEGSVLFDYRAFRSFHSLF